MIEWKKLGLVWAPDASRPWAQSYATMPTVMPLGESAFRVYSASLDAQRFGLPGYVDVDAEDPTRILAVSSEPVMGLGELGTFDDSGVTPSSIVRVGEELRLYYVGWQRAERVPYLLFTGLATSRDGGERFERTSPVPVLDRTAREPYLRSAPCILHEDGRYRCWYVSAHRWAPVRGVLYPEYEIRYAESRDGLSWDVRAEPVLTLASGSDEFGLGRPWVQRLGGRYHFWYSIRSHSRPYRIGYASSPDGIAWERRDSEAGIHASDPATNGWDAEMICYPYVLPYRDRLYMFFNGNQHGRTGFGVAVARNPFV